MLISFSTVYSACDLCVGLMLGNWDKEFDGTHREWFVWPCSESAGGSYKMSAQSVSICAPVEDQLPGSGSLEANPACEFTFCPLNNC